MHALSAKLTTWLAIVSGALAMTFILLSMVVLPLHPLSTELDASWVAFLSLADQHGWRAGSDYIFTYGPMGSWFWQVRLDESVAGAAFLRGISAVLVAFYIWTSAPPVRSAIVAAGTVYVALLFLIDLNGPIFAVSLVLAFALPQRSLFFVAILVAVLTVWGLVKFTGVVLLAGTIVGYLLLALVFRAESPALPVKRALICALVHLATIAAVYGLYLGEPVTGYVEYVRWSLEISKGYTQFMAVGRNPGLLVGYFSVLLTVFGLHLWSLRRTGAEPMRESAGPLIFGFDRRTIQLALCVVPTLLIAFKQGFVRQDGHETAAFVVAFLYASLVLASFRGRDRILLPAYVALVALFVPWALSFMSQPSHAWSEFGLWPDRLLWGWQRIDKTIALVSAERRGRRVGRRETQYRDSIEGLKQGLPALARFQSYDILGSEQTLALVNLDAYRPRPIFQGYSAYTSALQDLNGAHVERVPDELILTFLTIDNRFPNLDDGSALAQAILQFCPEEQNGPRLVLRRQRPAVSLAAIEALDWTTIRLDLAEDGLDLPDGMVLGRVDVELSLYGKLLAALYRLPPIMAAVTLSDGSQLMRRLIPTGRTYPAVVSPWLGTVADIEGLWGEHPTRSVTHIAFAGSSYNRATIKRLTVAYAPIDWEQISSKCTTPVRVLNIPPAGSSIKALSHGMLGFARKLDAHPHRIIAVPVARATHVKATLRLRQPGSGAGRSDGVDVHIYHYHRGQAHPIQSVRILPSQFDAAGLTKVYDGPVDLENGFLIFETQDQNKNWDWYSWEEIEVR